MFQEVELQSNVVRIVGLEVSLYLVNGGRQRFVQTDVATVQDILTPLRPDRLFTQEHLVFADTNSATIIPAANIERIELRSDSLAVWPHQAPIDSVIEIDKAEFQRIQRHEPPAPQRVLGRLVPGPPPSKIGVTVEFRSGTTIYLGVHLTAPSSNAPATLALPEDTRLLLQHLFSRHVLFGQTMDAKGQFLINPANVIRFTLTPPPHGVIAGAWSMTNITI